MTVDEIEAALGRNITPYDAQCAVATAALAILTRRFDQDSRADTWERVQDDLFAVRCYAASHIMVGTKDRRAAEDVIEILRQKIAEWRKHAEHLQKKRS